MPSQKAQKIDLNTEYPCPCRRRGALVPIALTEAFGCNKCQQIFVVEESGYVIEELSTTYPYKKVWRWTGYRWVTGKAGLKKIYELVSVGIILFLILGLVVTLVFNQWANQYKLLLTVVAVVVVLVPAFMYWLAYRR